MSRARDFTGQLANTKPDLHLAGRSKNAEHFSGGGKTEAHPHPKIRCANLSASPQGGGRLSAFAIALSLAGIGGREEIAGGDFSPERERSDPKGACARYATQRAGGSHVR